MIRYYTDFLFGVWPPLDTPILFNRTTNGGTARNLTFECIPSDFPTNSPTMTPSMTPSAAPSAAPTAAPTLSPHGDPTPPPTSSPSSVPTVAPSVDCEVLKINIPSDLTTGSNPQCTMDLQSVFGALWLRRGSRSDRPWWSLDCADSNAQYGTACAAGYSGSVLFLLNEWDIQIHSQSDDCFERFTVDETQSHFVPMDGQWTEQWAETQHLFTVECLDRVAVPTPSPSSSSSGGALSGSDSETAADRTWLVVAMVLMAAICALFVFGAVYWRRWRKPVVVYEPRAGASAQDLELQQLPQPAFVDEDIAQIAPDLEEDEKLDTPTKDGVPDGATGNAVGGTGGGVDPQRNPNLAQIQSKQSMRSLLGGASLIDGMYRSTSMISVGDGLQNETGNGMDGGNEPMEDQLEGDDAKMDQDRDTALDLIAGNRSISMVPQNEEEEHSQSELLYGDFHQKTVEGGDADGDASMQFDDESGVYSV